MGKTITLVLVCVLAGSVITYEFVSGSNPHQRQPAPHQGHAMLGDKEVGTLLASASGAWRATPRARTSSGAERASATEVVIVPAAKVPSFPQHTTSTPGDRGSLAQELQRELARVGCYDGEIHGVWTTSTRQAMKVFLERVNATLPINQPDGVLLALVRGQRVKTCGTSCPSGQTLVDDGRCVPTALLSREALKDQKKAILATTGWSTITTLAPTRPSSPIEGQMALAGPKPENKAEPVQPARDRSPVTRHNGGSGDWRAALWRRLPN
jgi:peptidoglycan hydrolase-like protein with peptidoglycan-binding domain